MIRIEDVTVRVKGYEAEELFDKDFVSIEDLLRELEDLKYENNCLKEENEDLKETIKTNNIYVEYV